MPESGRLRENRRGVIYHGLRHKRVSPEPLNLNPLDPGMLTAAPVDRGRNLLFYVPTKQKVRLDDDPAYWPVATDARSASRVFHRLSQRRTGRCHEPKHDSGLRRAGCHDEVVELLVGGWITRSATDHKQHGIRVGHRFEDGQGLSATPLRQRQNAWMAPQGVGLPHGEPHPGSTVANRLGNVPPGMSGCEQEQRRRHDLRAAPGRQPLEGIADRRTNDLEKSEFHGDIRQHLGHESRDIPRLRGPHWVSRTMPHDHKAAGPSQQAARNLFRLPIYERRAKEQSSERFRH